MDNQHQKISGYRDLSQEEINVMNAIKSEEAAVNDTLGGIKAILDNAGIKDPSAQRWLAIARTHLETGFMFAIKAIARPTNGLGRF